MTGSGVIACMGCGDVDVIMYGDDERGVAIVGMCVVANVGVHGCCLLCVSC